MSDVSFLGAVIRVTVKLGDNALHLDTFNDQQSPPPRFNDPVQVTIGSKDILVLGD